MNSRRSYIIIILLSVTIGCIIPFSARSEDRLSKRKKDVVAQVDTLKLHPEKIVLNMRSRDYQRDSLNRYCNDIIHQYNRDATLLNRWQKIAWLYEIGLVQSALDLNDQSIKTLETAVALTDQQKLPKVYARLMFELAFCYRQSSLFSKSNDLFTIVLNLPALRYDTAEQIHCTYFMADNYESLGEYQKAIELCQKLYRYSLRKGNYANASYNLIQTGRMASFLENDTSWLEYYHLANTMAKKTGIGRQIGNNLVSTGYAYNNEGYTTKAMQYFKAGESYASDFPPREHLYCLAGLCSACLNTDSIVQAFAYARKSMSIAKSIQGYQWMADACAVMADCYSKSGNSDSAAYYLKEAVRSGMKAGNREVLSNLFKKLSEISVSGGNYAEALKYLDSSYNEYKDFITANNNDKLARFRIQSDYYIHKAQISELISKNIAEKANRNRLIMLVIAITAILALTVLFLVLRHRQLIRLKESWVGLVKKNIELDQVNTRLEAFALKPVRKSKIETIKDEEIILAKLRKSLQADSIISDPDLSLKSLADELGTNTAYLSAIINKHFDRNFRSLINKCRVDKARRMLVSEEYSHYSMDGIAAESGFKSRSGFYLAFKAVTGLNPTHYLDSYRLAVVQPEPEPESENY